MLANIAKIGIGEPWTALLGERGADFFRENRLGPSEVFERQGIRGKFPEQPAVQGCQRAVRRSARVDRGRFVTLDGDAARPKDVFREERESAAPIGFELRSAPDAVTKA